MVSNNKIGQFIMHLVCILLCIICLAPFILLIVSSFTEEATLVRNGYSFFPETWSLESYAYIARKGTTIFRAYGITILITLVGTTTSLLMTVLFAYPLSRKELPGRLGLSFFVFFTMLFNGGLIPTYLMYTGTFHIKNTIFALLIPSLLMNAFYVIMMRSFFTANIPDSLVEAARIDGAGEYQILFKIVMPLSLPMLATLALMVGLGYWNDWLNGLYYLTDSSLFSIQNVLNKMVSDVQFLQTNASTLTSTVDVSKLPSVGIRMAIAVIGAIPVLCVYPFFQKYFVKGIVVGGVKG
ncbi:MAG: carbohydrate ABC transporter permease [Lachnospiraceae bacterium]|nr:carbohydrate ABC transporter permease [Lachnospiraceae bacterium]